MRTAAAAAAYYDLITHPRSAEITNLREFPAFAAESRTPPGPAQPAVIARPRGPGRRLRAKRANVHSARVGTRICSSCPLLLKGPLSQAFVEQNPLVAAHQQDQ